MEFGEKLRRRRLELSMTQDELARLTGYKSRSSIAKLESGTVDISREKLLKLANILDILPENLVGQDIQPKTDNRRKNVVIVLAGGKSTRNLMNIPNQFIMVDNKPVIIYVLEAYAKHPLIDEIVVVCLSGWEKILQSYVEEYKISKVREIVTGGETIIDSVKLGFRAIRQKYSPHDAVIIQEATRPMINSAMISKLLSEFVIYGSSVMVHNEKDKVNFIRNGSQVSYLNRNNLYSLESPEIYHVKTFCGTVDKLKNCRTTDSCWSVLMHKLGMAMHHCESSDNNIKIIRQEDVYIFKTLKQIIL